LNFATLNHTHQSHGYRQRYLIGQNQIVAAPALPRMKFSLLSCFCITTYAAFVVATVRFPSERWEMFLNIFAPTTAVVVLVLSFHYRSTTYFAYSAFYYLWNHLCENYGGYLFYSFISFVLSEKAHYYSDIVYNHICMIAGLVGMLVFHAFVVFDRSGTNAIK